MKERPILFSAPMVRAILEGRKTQTRRVVKCDYEIVDLATLERWARGLASNACFGRTITEEDIAQKADQLKGRLHPVVTSGGNMVGLFSPYGQPGDRLWVRETHMLGLDPDIQVGAVAYKADGYVRGGLGDFELQKWRPSIHMPRWASRILLEITAVRVERLQDISEADALSEGIESLTGDKTIYHWDFPKPRPKHAVSGYKSAQSAYKELWAEINGRESLDDNPFVWVVEFNSLEGGAA